MTAPNDRTAAEILAAGYATSPGPAKKGPAKLAALYSYDAQMEAAITLAKTDPAAFRTLPMSFRMSLGYYRAAKDAAEELAKEARS